MRITLERRGTGLLGACTAVGIFEVRALELRLPEPLSSTATTLEFSDGAAASSAFVPPPATG